MIAQSLLHFCKFRIGIDSPITQTTPLEQEALKKYAKDKNIAVEIGVFEGYNTALIAEQLSESGKLFAIDPFFKGKLGFSYGKSISKIYTQQRKVSQKISWVEGLSWNVIDSIPQNIDFIFIDGDHSFEGVKKDFELYSSKLSANGVIVFHDARVFASGWTKKEWGPVRLVEEVIKPSGQWDIVDEEDSVVVVKRKSAQQ